MEMCFLRAMRVLGLSKKDLAGILGVAPPTVSRWGNNPPQYVTAYLEERLLRKEAADRLQNVIVQYRKSIEDIGNESAA